jgi:hypothetical protein
MVPPAGIEPATPGLGKRTEGLYKGLKIPAKALEIKHSSSFQVYISFDTFLSFLMVSFHVFFTFSFSLEQVPFIH